MPAVFIAAASVFNLMALAGFYQPRGAGAVLGGPEQSANNDVFLTAAAPLDFDIARDPNETAGFAVIDSSFLLNPGSSLSNILPTRDGLMIYKVRPGDNLSKIAANFGISLNTIFLANPNLSERSLLRAGQELVILPVSGVLHEVKEGETLLTIAASYGVDANRIIKQNQKIAAGSVIIVPGAKTRNPSSAYRPAGNLPNLSNYFAIPTVGWNWGRLHPNNAVDIANICGTAVYAAAEGLVAQASEGWNSGYGSVIVIEHPNGTSTRYAHLQKVGVETGQFVVQSDLVGNMGNTGNTDGPSGCHLHFEVIGAQNPFVKR